MIVSVERFDEVSLDYEVADIKIEQEGNLSLWSRGTDGSWKLIGYINSGSWSAVFVKDLEKEARLGLS